MTGGRGVHAEAGWQVHGTDAVRLRNEHLSVVVLPSLGAKVWEVLDHRSGRQVLWHHPAVPPARVPFGATFDDVFAGGWDELFPNDMPEVLAGEPEPDHGEAWSLAWDWVLEDADADGSVTLRMSVRTPISACLLEKSVTLAPGARHVVVRSSVTSLSRRDLPFLWKQHLALDVADLARVDLPGREVLVEDFGAPRAGGPGTRFDWPTLVADGVEHDMRPTLPASSGACEFYYVTGLDDGWCALTYDDGTGVGLAFDHDVYPSCWVFASYGGWRDLQVAVLEPCTGYPVSVAEGLAAGTHRVLHSGERIETSMTLALFDGLMAVTGVRHDGTVVGTAS